MSEKSCLIFDSAIDSTNQLVEHIGNWNLFNSLEVCKSTDSLRLAYKKRLLSNNGEIVFFILGTSTLEKELSILISFLSDALNSSKVLLLRNAESPMISSEKQSQVEVIVINDPRFLSLRVKLDSVVKEVDSAQKKANDGVSSMYASSLGFEGETENKDPFKSLSFVQHVIKTIQRLEILLRSQSGAKLEDKIVPRFIVGKLSRELIESYSHHERMHNFRKHFEHAVGDWNRSLKKNSLETARELLTEQIFSFEGFAEEVSSKFKSSESLTNSNIVASTQDSPPSVEASENNGEANTSLTSAITQGFASLNDFWEDLWKDVDRTEISPADEAILEGRVRQFVITLFGDIVENELVREFRMYFEKHMMQWYRDARTMPQEEASAILRKRILSFPALSHRVVETTEEEEQENMDIADIMTSIVTSFNELIPLFEQGAFELNPFGMPTERTQKAISEFVHKAFELAPNTIRIEEFRLFFSFAIKAWVLTAHREGFQHANLELKKSLRSFYKNM